MSDGTNTTTYASTGTDTVADLLKGLNAGSPKNAQATAWLNGSGKLVIAAKNNTVSLAVGGSFASALGFKSGNGVFQPATRGSAAASSAASSPSASASATKSTSTKSSPPVLFNSAPAARTSSATASFLAGGIPSGSVINLLT